MQADSQCAYPCPDHSFSPPELDKMVTTVLVLASISFTLLFFMGISQLLVAEKRPFPANLPIWICLSLCMFNVAFFIGGRNPQKDVWCEDEGTYANQSNNVACGAQAFFFVYFGHVSLFMCPVLSFTLFYVVVCGKKLSEVVQKVAYFHGFIWGVPLIFAISGLASKNYGFSPIIPWCLYSIIDYSDLSGKPMTGLSADWPLYFLPLGFMGLVSVTLFIITEIKIFLVQRQVFKGTTVAAQRRVAFLITFLGLIILVILEWRIEIEAIGLNTMRSNITKWFLCKIKTELNLPNPGECPGDVSPSGISYGHAMLVTVLCASLGIIVFCVFGFDKEIYKVWPLVFTTVTQTHNYEELWKVIKHGTLRQTVWKSKADPRDRSSGSKNGSNSHRSQNSKNSQHSQHSQHSHNSQNSQNSQQELDEVIKL